MVLYVRKILENFSKICGIIDMMDFIKGMDSVGQLNPAPGSYLDYPTQNSTWKGVADSFKQAGDNIRNRYQVPF